MPQGLGYIQGILCIACISSICGVSWEQLTSRLHRSSAALQRLRGEGAARPGRPRKAPEGVPRTTGGLEMDWPEERTGQIGKQFLCLLGQ